jgi:CHAD domain-containing protein
MKNNLQKYLEKQLLQFGANFGQVCADSDADAVHDMRVAVKRIRALEVLAGKVAQNQIDPEASGDLRQLFKLSGRIRDMQVQQHLLDLLAAKLNTSFGELAVYLKNSEHKSIKKFTEFVGNHSDTDFAGSLAREIIKIFNGASENDLAAGVKSVVAEIIETVRLMKTDQQHEEYLHEIRRKLKQYNYLLSVYDKQSSDYAELLITLQHLEKANDLLGEWHDLDVAREILLKFLVNKTEQSFLSYSRYMLLLETIASEKQRLHLAIIELLEKELGI